MFRYLLLYALLGGVLVATAAEPKIVSIDGIRKKYPEAELTIETTDFERFITCKSCNDDESDKVFIFRKNLLQHEITNSIGGDGISGGGGDKIRH